MTRSRRGAMLTAIAARVPGMIGVLGLALGLLLGAGCGSDAPDAAFERLRVAVATGEPVVIFSALDTESRWAVDSTWGYHREMAEAALGLDEPARGRVLARVGLAASSPSAAAWFGARSAELGVLALVGGNATGLGTRASIRTKDATAIVVTSTGLEVPFARGPDGRWGWSALSTGLRSARDAAANDAARVAEDVQRLGAAK